MASPQKEHGYMKIANEIQDALARIRISGEAYQVLNVILRQTYGYNRKEDKISLNFFCQKTGLKKSHVCMSIKKLVEMNLITEKGNESREPNTYEFTKDFEKWKSLPKKVTLPKKVITITEKGNEKHFALYISKDNTKDNMRAKLATPKMDKKNADDEHPMTRTEFVKKMRESPQGHMKFLAEYADEKKINFQTKGQWRMFIGRNVRPASRISKYSEEQISTAFEEMKKDVKSEKNKKGFITKWGIETIEKYLDELKES